MNATPMRAAPTGWLATLPTLGTIKRHKRLLGAILLFVPLQGKVTVAIQGRTAEFAAVTAGADLPTGSDARIVRQIDENTFEIEGAS